MQPNALTAASSANRGDDLPMQSIGGPMTSYRYNSAYAAGAMWNTYAYGIPKMTNIKMICSLCRLNLVLQIIMITIKK